MSMIWQPKPVKQPDIRYETLGVSPAERTFLHHLRDLCNLILGAITFLGFFAWRAFREIGAMARRGAAKVERILTYLASRQRREVLYPYIDEIGLAWNVLLAASPEKLIPMWAKREEELLKWLDGEHHIAPCGCAECELKRTNMGLAVQLSLNLVKTVPFPSSGRTPEQVGPQQAEACRLLSQTPGTPDSSDVALAETEFAVGPDSDRKSPQPETPEVKKATA